MIMYEGPRTRGRRIIGLSMSETGGLTSAPKQRAMLRRSFESWARDVNYWTMALIGLGRESLPDIDYQCLYNSGISARAAAQEAIKEVSRD